MAPQNLQRREYSAAELAMLDDIGVGRVDELPLEDTGMVPRSGAAMNNIESGRTGTKNSWNQAIAEGAFEDEDAAVVAGQNELGNGQLARMRRAADLSFMAVNRNFDYNDRRLRQNHNGQIAPRARFSRGERGPARAGLNHTGNGPVELRGAIRPSHRGTAPAPVLNINLQHPIGPSRNDRSPPVVRLPPVVPNAHSTDRTSSPISPAARPLDRTRTPAQPVAVPTQSSSSQEEARVRSTKVKLELPDGYSILFQAPVTFASPTFINRTAEYPGTIYLINGPITVEDQIILHIDEDRVEDVARRSREYVDYLSDSDRLILQFKDDSGYITWFVVVFRQRDTMVSFVEALRKFVDRLKEPTTSPASTNIGTPTVGTEQAVSIEPPRDASAPIVESPQQQDTTDTISVAILEDIVSWAMHIVVFIRDAGPAELASADALPGIIRGASAAVLIEKQPGFSDLEPKERVAFVDDVCVPKVFERFQRRIKEEDAKKGPTESESTIVLGAQTSLNEQETTQCLRPKYTIDRLIQLESTAIDPPDWLPELRYLPEMNPETRVRIHEIIQRADELHSSSLLEQTAQVLDKATTPTLRAGYPQADHSLDGHASPARARDTGSRRADAVLVQTAPALPTHAPSITVTAPVGMPDPEEPLISIHGEMSGLNSSRHNQNGRDILGQSAGQFTGVLSRDKSHLADLMLLDRVEDFDVIRANDPEVAEIADRFARVHFSEGRPT